MARKKHAFWCWLPVALLPLLLGAKIPPVEGRWQKTPLVIDGEISDWTAPFFYGEKSVQVDYAFGNDAENLYVLFIFKDPKYLSSIARTGLTIWFNGENKKKKELGVRFDKQTLASAELIAAMEKKSGPLSPEKKKEMLAKPAYVINRFLAVDKNGNDRSAQLSKPAAEPEFNSLLKPGRLIYEMKIPLGSDYGPGLAPGKAVMVGFDWGGLTQQMRRDLARPAGSGGGDELRVPETQDLDLDSLNNLEDGDMPIMRGPRHYSFWCSLTLAAGR